MSLTVSLFVNAVVVVAFLWFIHKDREATARVLAGFARDAHEREMQQALAAHEREQALIQRIQAPKAEVVRWHYEQGDQRNPVAVRVDDDGDESFWESREELAERVAAEEVNRG